MLLLWVRERGRVLDGLLVLREQYLVGLIGLGREALCIVYVYEGGEDEDG